MFKAVAKIFLLIFWIFLACLVALLIKKFGSKYSFDKATKFLFATICRIIGIQVKTIGSIADSRPLLLVSNHISYLDIFVLGAATNARFTPKSEVGKWPVIGSICRLLGAVFIERKNSKIGNAGSAIKQELAKGEIISLFAEGTTGNGVATLPFKSSLFQIAEEKIGEQEICVQPAKIRYTHIGGLPIDSSQMPKIAWYGDMSLLPHLLELLKLGKIKAELEFFPAVRYSDLGDRKKLATHCQEVVSSSRT